MTLQRNELKQKANNLLNNFELYHFQNILNYNRQLNLAFEFCDYINQMPDWQLLAELNSDKQDDAKHFRNMINNDIDFWLSDQLKTICF
ncbi:MAG: hypothetical protein IJW72_02155 [Alphaproteobacteria bacterium]|nr:hypothetical protein [Alphaproteobacteria bacterium]MBQ7285040.1 hypothetical protein [Alphaproteobacteria bacterium]